MKLTRHGWKVKHLLWEEIGEQLKNDSGYYVRRQLDKNMASTQLRRSSRTIDNYIENMLWGYREE